MTVLAMVPCISFAIVSNVDEAYFSTGSKLIDFEPDGGSIQELPIVDGIKYVSETSPSGQLTFGVRQYTGGLLGSTYGFANIVGDANTLPKFSDLGIDFTRPTIATGAWIGWITNYLGRSPATIDVSVFDTSHALVASRHVDLLSNGGAPLFVGFFSEAGIGRIEWRANNGGFFAVDNFVVSLTSPVPDVPAWAAYFVGVIVLSLRCARRRLAKR